MGPIFENHKTRTNTVHFPIVSGHDDLYSNIPVLIRKFAKKFQTQRRLIDFSSILRGIVQVLSLRNVIKGNTVLGKVIQKGNRMKPADPTKRPRFQPSSMLYSVPTRRWILQQMHHGMDL
jgi:hypothetical protein